MGLFKDPRMDFAFIRTWDSTETYCAKEAMRRSDEIEQLKRELAEYRALGPVNYLRDLIKTEKKEQLSKLKGE